MVTTNTHESTHTQHQRSPMYAVGFHVPQPPTDLYGQQQTNVRHDQGSVRFCSFSALVTSRPLLGARYGARERDAF
jgi:hypothetical protein